MINLHTIDELKIAFVLQVYFSDFSLDNWIVYDKRSQHLQGVPIKQESDNINFLVVVLKNESPIYRLSCSVNVIINNKDDSTSNFYDFLPSTHPCLSSETVVTLVIRLDIDKNTFYPSERIKLLIKFHRFLELTGESKTQFLTLEPEHTSKYSAVFFGMGDAPKTNFFPGIAVSWPLGCTTVDPKRLDDFEKFAQNGTIAHTTGYNVIEWQVENRKRKHNRKPRSSFYKR